MAAKITDEAWAEARKRYEAEPKTGYGQIAQALDCSRNLVARRAQKEGWVKQTGPTHAPFKEPARAAVDEEGKFTEIAGDRAEKAVPVYTSAPETRAPVAPAAAIEPGDGDEMPENLSPLEQEQWIEAAVRRRQTALQRKQAKELAAAKSTLYAAIKGAGSKDGYDLARTSKQIISAMTEQHASEMASEARGFGLSSGSSTGPRGRGHASFACSWCLGSRSARVRPSRRRGARRCRRAI
jgi:hypothetical protein